MKTIRYQEDWFGLEGIILKIAVAREKYGGPEAI